MIILLNGTGCAARWPRWSGGSRPGATGRSGQVRAHFVSVHAHVGYDVEVDTSLAGPDECAEVVAAAVARHRGPSRLAALV